MYSFSNTSPLNSPRFLQEAWVFLLLLSELQKNDPNCLQEQPQKALFTKNKHKFREKKNLEITFNAKFP